MISACSTSSLKNENEVLLAKVDSLERAIETNEYTVGLLESVSQYLDSIDTYRQWVSINLETGVTEEEFIGRMKNLYQYVQKAEWTVGELEKTRTNYGSQVKRLKTEIEDKNDKIKRMQISVDQSKDDIRLLQFRLVRKQQDLMEKEASLAFTKKELSVANEEIQGLMRKVQLNEAEIHFALGEGMEEVANKIRFAPKKKRESLEEALKSYTVAYEMGYEPAFGKVNQLKAQLKMD